MLHRFFFGVAVWLLIADVVSVAPEDDAVQDSEFPEVCVAGFPGFASLSSVLGPIPVHFYPTIPLDSDIVTGLWLQAPAPPRRSGVVIDGGVNV